MPVKILIQPDSHLDDHARHLVRKYAERSLMPRLGSNARVMTPQICSDCSATYWEPLDTWGPHLNCPGGPKPEAKAGF
jgi:hypothetical protein